MKKIIGLMLIVLTIVMGCSSNPIINKKNENFNINNIKTNLEFLSSDELEGREATTRGERLAALYISTQLKKYGVKPFFSDSSYLQPFDVSVSSIDTNSTLNFLDDNNNLVHSFNFREDFFSRMEDAFDADTTTALVFAGYGITAQRNNYDDYSDINVAGKYVVLFSGEPSDESEDFFKGEDDTDYSSNEYKIKNAKDHGALGCIIPISEQYQMYWEFIKRFAARPNFKLYDAASDKENFVSLSCNRNSLPRLFDNQPFSYDSLVSISKSNSRLPHFIMSEKFKINFHVYSEIRKAYNVVGVIEGTDEQLKDEYIAVGAHYDHLGVQNGEIYNGADDDGSGTVSVLEVAKVLAANRNNKRSVLIVFHTAEEKGLFGSEYFTNNFPALEKISAQINIDMVGRESIDTIFSVGSDKLSSELKQIVETENNKSTQFVFDYKFDDPNDPEKIYYRSDHYNYAKHGIPIVFFYDYMLSDYHKPSDDFEKINFNKIEKTAKLVYNIIDNISNLDHKLIVDKKVEEK